MKYQHPSVRGYTVLKAATEAASMPGGWAALTRARIASHAKCSDGLVSRYLGSMENARRLILEVAIVEEILPIIVQLLGEQVKLPTALKQKALRTLSGK